MSQPICVFYETGQMLQITFSTDELELASMQGTQTQVNEMMLRQTLPFLELFCFR